MNQFVKIAIGLGGNLGDRLGMLKRAAEALDSDLLEAAESSRVYESPPWGITEQPDFLNAVIVGESEWKPPAIINFLKTLERDLGRVEGKRYGPRLIDLDLLAYGENIWESEGVCVPHPRLGERDFVLLPFNEVWPDWKHPRVARTAAELVSDLSRTQPLTAKVFGPPLLDKESR